MCGRYRRTTQEEELARIYHIPIPKQTDLPISFNIAPSQKVLTIRFNPETQQRSLDALQWGLIPYWAKDPKIAYKTINARVETVDTAPSYRQAFRKRRCLVPADGFYEWKKVVGGKIGYSIGMKDDAPFVFAGLREGWKDPTTEEWLHTCTIITLKTGMAGVETAQATQHQTNPIAPRWTFRVRTHGSQMLTPEQNDAIFGPSIRVFRFKLLKGEPLQASYGEDL